MFETILIANRGEIACRVITTCRRLGIRSIAVYAEADRDAPFVRMADAAYPIGRSEPEHSYLRGERILAAALHAGAGAIHPGYGFLAENAGLAEACRAHGITFIGPPPAAMRAMGLKDAAKQRMMEAGVRVVPGYQGEDQTLAHLTNAAEQIGYPVLIKAVAGGGGKGMRRVERASELSSQLESARREAQSAFGDARVLLEKYLEKPRHIEVQVFADRQGQVVHLFTRDCSLQRRHQKILEEAPAPGMTQAFEDEACALAVAATRAIDYEGAGTVELIADVREGLDPERVYFMEMNTRLQVEHPVTESITGLDLVEWQIRVAGGEPLPRTQPEITRRGHAIEVRLYAEDPARDYMPQTGKLLHLALPKPGPNVRVDAGYREGDTVSVYYDALLAKLIVWDLDRASAVRRLVHALDACEVAGLTTNLALLSAIARAAPFAAGDVHTGFIAEHATTLLARDPVREEQLWLAACVGRIATRRARLASDPSPWAATDAFRLNGPQRDELVFLHEGERRAIQVTFTRHATLIALPERTVSVRNIELCDRHLRYEADCVELRAIYLERAERALVLVGAAMLEAPFFPSPLALEDEAAGSGVVKAPMPGKIHALMVAVGDTVTRGQPLISLEAMKMEHTLRAGGPGTVHAVSAQVGDQVEEGATLLVLRAGEEE